MQRVCVDPDMQAVRGVTVLRLVCEFWVDAANVLWLVQMLSPVICDGNSNILITTGLPKDGLGESWQVSLRDSGGRARAATSLSSIRKKSRPSSSHQQRPTAQ